MDKIGIYGFIDTQTNQYVYVGQSKHLYQRMGSHYMFASMGKGGLMDTYLAQDFERYKWVIIEECDEADLNEREAYWIEFYRTIENGYNLKTGAGNIIKLNPDNQEPYAVYRTVVEAANATGISANSIYNCLAGRATTAGGWGWTRQYEGQASKVSKASSTKTTSNIGAKTPVGAYSITGELLDTYESCSAAARALGVTPGAISNVLKGRAKTCKGRVFRYLTQVEQWES